MSTTKSITNKDEDPPVKLIKRDEKGSKESQKTTKKTPTPVTQQTARPATRNDKTTSYSLHKENDQKKFQQFKSMKQKSSVYCNIFDSSFEKFKNLGKYNKSLAGLVQCLTLGLLYLTLVCSNDFSNLSNKNFDKNKDRQRIFKPNSITYNLMTLTDPLEWCRSLHYSILVFFLAVFTFFYLFCILVLERVDLIAPLVVYFSNDRGKVILRRYSSKMVVFLVDYFEYFFSLRIWSASQASSTGPQSWPSPSATSPMS